MAPVILQRFLFAIDDDVMADVFLKQLVRADQIVLKILLQNRCGFRCGERFKTHRRRIDPGGHIGKLDRVFTGDQIDLPRLPHHAIAGNPAALTFHIFLRIEEAGIGIAVYRQRKIGLLSRRCRIGRLGLRDCER